MRTKKLVNKLLQAASSRKIRITGNKVHIFSCICTSYVDVVIKSVFPIMWFFTLFWVFLKLSWVDYFVRIEKNTKSTLYRLHNIFTFCIYASDNILTFELMCVAEIKYLFSYSFIQEHKDRWRRLNWVCVCFMQISVHWLNALVFR